MRNNNAASVISEPMETESSSMIQENSRHESQERKTVTFTEPGGVSDNAKCSDVMESESTEKSSQENGKIESF